MAKQIVMQSAAAKAEAVEKLLVKREERLRTKKFPRLEKFDEEMKLSKLQYEWRVEGLARLNYAKKICKAAGLPVEETTANVRDVFDNGGTRTGALIQDGVQDTLVTIRVHGTTNEHAYVEAFAAYGHATDVVNCVLQDKNGWGRVLLTVKM